MEKVREHWSSKIGFLFAALGAAIGIGVLWKFPYTAGQNGGGLFLLAYVGCVLLIGIPVFIAELLIGRTSQRGAILSFDLLEQNKPFWKCAGWLGVISSFLIMSFYSVVSGWGMSYLLGSFISSTAGKSAAEVANVFTTLQNSGDIICLWHFLFTLITMLIVLSGVRQGIERWSKIMTQGLFGMLLILVLYCCTLPGFGEALRFILTPNPATFKFSSVIEALGLAFFTLSLGQGIMFSYGSYMKGDNNIPLMATVVSLAVVLVSVLASLIVFPVVFSFGFEPAAGIGLIFQTLPYLFGQLPGGQILSMIFFTLFTITAITSAIAFLEVCGANLMEMFGMSRKRALIIVSSLTFIVGIPAAYSWVGGIFPVWQEIYGTNFLDTIDQLVSIWLIPIGGLITALFVGWSWNKEKMEKAFKGGGGSRGLFQVWHLWMRWGVPLLIVLMLLQKSEMLNLDLLFKK